MIKYFHALLVSTVVTEGAVKGVEIDGFRAEAVRWEFPLYGTDLASSLSSWLASRSHSASLSSLLSENPEGGCRW